MIPRNTFGTRTLGAAILTCGLLFGPGVTTSDANVASCRKESAKQTETFAKKRAKLMLACKRADDCDSARLADRLQKLRDKTRAKLASGCSGTTGDELGLDGSCPDPTGECTQDVTTQAGLVDCLVCVMGETLEPLLRRLHGHHGDLAESCGGCAANECSEGTFCETRRGRCDDPAESGRCMEVPDACPDVYEPVCGCDGETYSNNCERRVALVGLAHEGPCRRTCDPSATGECPDGTHCVGAPGLCGDATEGRCQPAPDACPDVRRPVCGCDGETYSNDCERQRAGVGLDHHGACRDTCGTDSTGGPQCDNGSFCELPPRSCDETGVAGVCMDQPDVCPQHIDPVCGCDGVTYDNDCLRQAAGVAKDHRGRCESICGGFAGVECAADEFCQLPPNQCNVSDAEGRCVDHPDTCPTIFDPVCGCDGETYPNNCARIQAGVQLDHFGPCERTCDPASGAASSCHAGEVCLPPGGECGSNTGHCVETPDQCPADQFEVCGCDRVTYDNRCRAAQAGAGIAHPGPCDTSGGPGGCDSSNPCPNGEECRPVPGHCADAQPPSVCVAPHQGPCPAHFDPVCGCDGVTYSNPCEARRAGAAIDHEGECFSD